MAQANLEICHVDLLAGLGGESDRHARGLSTDGHRVEFVGLRRSLNRLLHLRLLLASKSLSHRVPDALLTSIKSAVSVLLPNGCRSAAERWTAPQTAGKGPFRDGLGTSRQPSPARPPAPAGRAPGRGCAAGDARRPPGPPRTSPGCPAASAAR